MQTLFFYWLAVSFIGTGVVLFLNYLIFLAPSRKRLEVEKQLSLAPSKKETIDWIAHLFIPGLALVLFPISLIAFGYSLIALNKKQKIAYPTALNVITDTLMEYQLVFSRNESKHHHDSFVYEYECTNPFEDAFYLISKYKLEQFQKAVAYVVNNRHKSFAETICLNNEQAFLKILEVFETDKQTLQNNEDDIKLKMNLIVDRFVDQVNAQMAQDPRLADQQKHILVSPTSL